MRCNHCRSQMLSTDLQQEGRSQQTSYLCPLCGATAASFRLLGERELARRPSPQRGDRDEQTYLPRAAA